MLKVYKVTVYVEDKTGERFKYSATRAFVDVVYRTTWIEGFSQGAAQAHDASVKKTEIETLTN